MEYLIKYGIFSYLVRIWTLFTLLNCVDVFTVAKTKINQSFLTAKLVIEGFHKPLRLDVRSKSRVLLIYVRSNLPLRQLTKHKISSDIQALALKINLRKKNQFFLSKYKHPSENCQYFLDSLHNIIDFYSGISDNHTVLDNHSWNMIITTTLVKITYVLKVMGSCIDLILTNKKYCSKNKSFFETGISDHHHLIYSTQKTTFAKEEPKNVTFRNYKQFQGKTFEKDLTSSLKICNGGYKNEERNFIKLLSTYTPQKLKISRGNHKPHYNKSFGKTVMIRSLLKNRINQKILLILLVTKNNATQLFR